jgi:hypothetical protein
MKPGSPGFSGSMRMPASRGETCCGWIGLVFCCPATSSPLSFVAAGVEATAGREVFISRSKKMARTRMQTVAVDGALAWIGDCAGAAVVDVVDAVAVVIAGPLLRRVLCIRRCLF